MKNWELARRDLLKQLGLGLACLPVLNASRSWAQGATAPPKLIIIFASEGYRMAQWKPAVGPIGTLPQSTSPLQPWKDYVTFLTDMTNPNYKGGEKYGHEAYGTIFWGGAKTKGSGKAQEPVGSTFDQVIADGLNAKTPVKERSLAFQVQLDRAPNQKNVGQNRCFYRDGSPINPEANPTDTFARLFAGAAPTNPGAGDAAKKQIAQRKSILDYVGNNLEAFKARVASEDRKTIDSHLGAIRDLENQLSGTGMPTGASCGDGDPGKYTKDQILADEKLYPTIMQSYMDIMLAAVHCGVTNVATLQISDSSGNQVNFGSFVDGIPPRGTGYKSAFRNWHDLGHNPVLSGVDHHRIVDQWCMQKYADYLTKVKAVPHGSGTMLDSSLVMWTNHMEDGESHNSQKVPWVLAGKVGGKINTGISAASAGKPIQSAMADIITAMGVTASDPFTGSIPGLRKA
jgi:hypothetical protein